MKIGFIGLGNMGLNMVKNLLGHGHEVVAWNRSVPPRIEAESVGAQAIPVAADFKSALEPVRIVFSMVSAGSAIDQILFDSAENSVINVLEAGDIFVDCANSFYKDSISRCEKLAEKGILMLDIGISGGIEGARNGVCAMAGGDKAAFDLVEPIFKSMSVENGYGYFGKSGSGHYIKMVHNAIEYGMMQAISEGMNLLYHSDFKPDYNKLLNVWKNGSVIEGKLIEHLASAFSKDQALELAESEVGSLGTGMWASEEALKSGVPFTSITHAVFNRYQSKGGSDFAFKVLQAMRSEFGGHTSNS